jgi:hypothetical protein
VAAAGLTAGAVAAGIPLAGAAGSVRFVDPPGDAGAGFDMTDLTVRNDDAGRLTFRIGLPALTALPPNMVASVVLDTDLNRREQNPIDYVLTSIDGIAAVTPATAAGAPGAPFIPRSITTTFAPGALTIGIDRKDIGSPRALIPVATTLVMLPDGSLDPANQDLVPAAEVYELKLPARLVVRSSNLSPGRPAAGGPFRASVYVRDVTFGAPGDAPTGGRVTCAFTVGGRKVTARRSVNAAGRVACAGTVPAGAAGQRLAGKVTYAQKGARVSRTFSAVVG